MASARFSRSEQARFCAVAQSPKASDDFGKSQIDVPFDVFGKDGAGPDFPDDPLNLWPQVPGVVLTGALPCQAEWLAGITGREDMNAVTPRPAVEGSDIAPDRRMIQRLVFHPCHERCRSMGFPLDVTNSSIGWLGNGQSKVEASVACAEGNSAQAFDSIGGTYSHKAYLQRCLTGQSEKGSGASID